MPQSHTKKRRTDTAMSSSDADSVSNVVGENAVTTDAVTTDAVTTDAVTTDAVTTDAVITDAVITDAVITDAVITDAVTTDAVITDAVITDAVITDAVITDAVITDAVITDAVTIDPVTIDPVVISDANANKQEEKNISNVCEIDSAVKTLEKAMHAPLLKLFNAAENIVDGGELEKWFVSDGFTTLSPERMEEIADCLLKLARLHRTMPSSPIEAA